MPPMVSFKRGLLGYRRGDVDAALAERDTRIAEFEAEVSCLTRIVVEREREIERMGEQVREATARQHRSLTSLESVAERLEEIHAQARGQATRIRMKALSEAAEVSRRAHDLDGRLVTEEAGSGSAEATEVDRSNDATEGLPPLPVSVNGNGHSPDPPEGVFEGDVRVEIGPLGDFSQLVGFEDAAGQIGGTSEISVERFSEGRATISMRLNEPVELLRELEERSPLEFRVRHTGGEGLILDVDSDEDQGPDQRAA